MKILSSFILLLSFFSITSAQDSLCTAHQELKHGIQFQIDGLLELRNFNGYTFSYRYRFDKNSGLRIGFYAYVTKSDYDIIQQEDSIINNPPSYSNYYNFKLSVQYLTRIISYNNFSMFCGAGPFIFYDKSESHSEYLYSSYKTKSDQKVKGFGFGLDMLLGADYDLTENVILSGEYGISFYQQRSDIDEMHISEYYDGSRQRISSENGKKDSFSINGLSAKLGISIFF